MARTLKLQKPVGEAIRSLAGGLSAAAERELQKAADMANVHQARRALKRLRSLIRLVRPAIGKAEAKDAGRAIKLAADGLAGARRQEALSLAVSRLTLPGDLRAGLEAVIGRRLGPGHAPDQLQAGVQQALEGIAAFRRATKRWPLPKSDRRFCVDGLERTYAKARKALKRATGSGRADDLHEARKHVIHNLHHLDMLRALWPEILGPWVAELTVLREALGDFNDLDELRSLTDELAEDERAPVRAVIDAAAAGLVKSAAGKARLLYAEKPAAFSARMEAMWQKASGQ